MRTKGGQSNGGRSCEAKFHLKIKISGYEPVAWACLRPTNRPTILRGFRLTTIRQSSPMPMTCPFCQIRGDQVRLQNAAGLAIRDGYPISEGHTLVVPRKHVLSVFDLPADEYAALWRLVAEVRSQLQAELQPAGFNVGSTMAKPQARPSSMPISM